MMGQFSSKFYIRVSTSDGTTWWVGQGQGDKWHLMKTNGVRGGQAQCGGQRNYGLGRIVVDADTTPDQVSERLCARCYKAIEAAVDRHATLRMDLVNVEDAHNITVHNDAFEEVDADTQAQIDAEDAEVARTFMEGPKSMGNCLVCGQPVLDPNCGWGQGQPIHMDGRGCFDKVDVARPSDGGPATPVVRDQEDVRWEVQALVDGDEYPVILDPDDPSRLTGGVQATKFYTLLSALDVAATRPQVWEGAQAVIIYRVGRDAQRWVVLASQKDAATVRAQVGARRATGSHADDDQPMVTDPETGDTWNIEALHRMIRDGELVTGTVELVEGIYHLDTITCGIFSLWLSQDGDTLLVQVNKGMPQRVKDPMLVAAFSQRVQDYWEGPRLVTGYYAGMRLDSRDGSGLVIQQPGDRLLGCIIRGYTGMPNDPSYYWSAYIISGHGITPSGMTDDGQSVPKVDFARAGNVFKVKNYQDAQAAFKAVCVAAKAVQAAVDVVKEGM